MKINVYGNLTRESRIVSPEIMAMVEGLKRHGHEPNLLRVGQAAPCDLAVVWGVKRRREFLSGRRCLVLERGYVGDRMKTWTSAGFDGLNGLADFRNKPCPDAGERWNQHFASEMKPWREGGGKYVLIMGQVHGDASLRGMRFALWARELAQKLQHKGHHVAFRPHPLFKMDLGLRPLKQLDPRAPMAEALAEAKWVVTFNSNAGVLSVLEGIPTVTLDLKGGSMAHAVTGHVAWDRPPTPDRTEWANRLAWTQWRAEELASGAAWEHLKGGVE
jgi:hypothetical protein